MGERSCPACGGELAWWRPATPADPTVEEGPGTYALERCVECGTAITVRTGPSGETSESLAELYEGGYYARPPGLLDRLIEPLRRIADRGRAKRLGPVESERVVEFGAGDGRLLEYVAGKGASVTGVEPSGSARQRAAERGIDLYPDLDRAGLEPESVDLIVAWHVLEHLVDPASDLRRLRALLRPGGRLVISVPNIASLQARIGADSWFGQDVPRHLAHFTPAGIEAIARRTGLGLEAVGYWSLEQNPFGMWQTLVNRASGSRDVIFRVIKGQPLGESASSKAASILGLVMALPVLLIAVPLEIVASAFRSGGTLTATLRRASEGEADR